MKIMDYAGLSLKGRGILISAIIFVLLTFCFVNLKLCINQKMPVAVVAKVWNIKYVLARNPYWWFHKTNDVKNVITMDDNNCRHSGILLNRNYIANTSLKP